MLSSTQLTEKEYKSLMNELFNKLKKEITVNKEERLKLVGFTPEASKELYIPTIHWHRYKKEIQVFQDFVEGKFDPKDVNKIKALVADFVGAFHLDNAIEEKIKSKGG